MNLAVCITAEISPEHNCSSYGDSSWLFLCWTFTNLIYTLPPRGGSISAIILHAATQQWIVPADLLLLGCGENWGWMLSCSSRETSADTRSFAEPNNARESLKCALERAPVLFPARAKLPSDFTKSNLQRKTSAWAIIVFPKVIYIYPSHCDMNRNSHYQGT